MYVHDVLSSDEEVGDDEVDSNGESWSLISDKCTIILVRDI